MLTYFVNEIICVVEIYFKSNKLEKQLTNPKTLIKTFGQLAQKVNQRMEELKSADTLAILRLIPAAKCHELKGSRNGELAISISGNYRLIFIPKHNPVPRKEDGGLDWESVTIIRIEEIKDYH